MCTATLLRTSDTLLLTMNRDEARTRGPERPPACHAADHGLCWAAPADSDKGGTWMAMNNHGLVGCLLNRYQDNAPVGLDVAASRGLILPRLMEERSVSSAQMALDGGALPVDAYPPFTLVLAGPDSAVQVDWRGAGPLLTAAIAPGWALITSSFFEPEKVLPWRRGAFDTWLAAGASMERGVPALHLHCPPGAEAVAPMMSRDISCTRSITQITLDLRAGTAVLRYAPVHEGIPDWPQFEQQVNFPLHRHSEMRDHA